MASSSSQPEPNKILDLCKAIHDRNLQSVQELCNGDEYLLEARITDNFDTALHVAVGTDKAIPIVQYLLNKMSPNQLELKNNDGNTVLAIAAIVGNVEAAKIIMKEQSKLNDVAKNFIWTSLIEAARHGHEEMTRYLLQFSESHLQSDKPSTPTNAVAFLNFVITAGFYDLALDLVKRHPSLATTIEDGKSLLSGLASMPSAFPSGRKLDFRKSDIFGLLAIFIKWIRSGKTVKNDDKKVVQLVQILCKTITSNLDHKNASSILQRPFLLAAELGVHEVVEMIMNLFPGAVWFSDAEKHNAFHLAVMNRREKVFNLIFKLSEGHKQLLLRSKDKSENNILHLAGKKAPQNQLNLIIGTALQMQRELQWFQGVENILLPAYKEDINKDGKTPAMVFTKEHEELVKEGEKWMKEAATSYSIVAALIATVVFAAAITVPGGESDNGQPNFYKQTAFGIFSVADSFSLFTSIASILIFLSVITARYAEDDFLYILPMRFISGLLLLLLAVASMMITSVITIYLVFSDRKAEMLSLVVLYGILLAYLFTYTQVPLVMEMIISTQGPCFFDK